VKIFLIEADERVSSQEVQQREQRDRGGILRARSIGDAMLKVSPGKVSLWTID
jgi:hypothetical protein